MVAIKKPDESISSFLCAFESPDLEGSFAEKIDHEKNPQSSLESEKHEGVNVYQSIVGLRLRSTDLGWEK